MLYVWFGGEAEEDIEMEGGVDIAGGRIGEECAMRLGIGSGHEVMVEVEGKESSEFWEAFEAGYEAE